MPAAGLPRLLAIDEFLPQALQSSLSARQVRLSLHAANNVTCAAPSVAQRSGPLANTASGYVIPLSQDADKGDAVTAVCRQCDAITVECDAQVEIVSNVGEIRDRCGADVMSAVNRANKEIHLVAVFEVGNDIVAKSDVELERIVAVVAGQDIVSDTARDKIISAPAKDD